MGTPSILRIIVKDIVDFVLIVSITVMLTFFVYLMVPNFERVNLSLYFFEQLIEIFFVNPKLCQWLLGLGFGVTFIYFLLCAMLFQTTVGGVIARVKIVDRTSLQPLSLVQALIMAMGAYIGVIALLLGPLSAWWLDGEHRGFAEKLSRTWCVTRA